VRRFSVIATCLAGGNRGLLPESVNFPRLKSWLPRIPNCQTVPNVRRLATDSAGLQ